MIDFNNKKVFKLKPVDNSKMLKPIKQFLLDDENVISVFKSMRDQVVFTNKRIISANVKGITGKQVDYTSVPYSKIDVFSIETAGLLDLDCEIELYVGNLAKIRFEIKGGFDIVRFNQILSKYVLR